MKYDRDFLLVSSLQYPILGDILQFEIAVHESALILHSRGCNWIAMGTIGCKHPIVTQSQQYPLQQFAMEDLIATLVSTRENTMTLECAIIHYCGYMCT